MSATPVTREKDNVRRFPLFSVRENDLLKKSPWFRRLRRIFLSLPHRASVRAVPTATPVETLWATYVGQWPVAGMRRHCPIHMKTERKGLIIITTVTVTVIDIFRYCQTCN